MNYTRTVNPLQFDALEPKRFEDLVRQLLYDFRNWQQLEPTGRGGADDGFDARGWEIVPAAGDIEPELDEVDRPGTDRIWLIQCKRERAIGPSKIIEYLNDIALEERGSLYGIVLAAPADFSKKSHDAFREWCAEHAIRECYLWGKAALEDMLFQPKNDHLLFAYFGLSLVIRQRSDQTRLRAQTTIKRKIKRAFENKYEILIRDIADDGYPYSEGRDDFRWWVYHWPEMTFRGLECLSKKYFAYIADDGIHWDCANALDDNQNFQHDDPWRGVERGNPDRTELWEFWSQLPKQNQAWVTVKGIIPFQNIVEIDDIGDDITSHVHLYVRTDPSHPDPFAFTRAELKADDRWAGVGHIDLVVDNRVEVFPAKFRKPVSAESSSEAEDWITQ